MEKIMENTVRKTRKSTKTRKTTKTSTKTAVKKILVSVLAAAICMTALSPAAVLPVRAEEAVETQAEAAQPEAAEPEAAESEAAEPEATEPEAAEPETAESETAEPETAESEEAESEATESQTAESETAEPEADEDALDPAQAAQSGFVPMENTFRYYDPKTGEYLTGLQTIDGYTYYFYPETGCALYGQHNIDGKAYYFDPETCRMRTGIVEIVYSGGTARKHYFLPEGGMASGWVEENGNKYYFSSPETGAIMLTGKQRLDGKLYYFDVDTGIMQVGVTVTADGSAYYFDPAGDVRMGLQEWQGDLYFFRSEKSGLMDYGLDSIGDKLYYFDPQTGAAWKNATVNLGHIIYTFGPDGTMTQAVPETGYENSLRTQLILNSFEFLGEPYALEKESGFSCGYFVKTALATIGINIPTSSDQQAKAVVEDGLNGVEISKDELRIGDVIYWRLDNCGDPSCGHWHEIHHVAIYIGDGKAIESVEHRGGVTVDTLREYETYTIQHYVRYINEADDPYVDEKFDLPVPQKPAVSFTGYDSAVQLSWSYSKQVDGFILTKEDLATGKTEEVELPGDVYAYSDENIQYGKTYAYQIKAYIADTGAAYQSANSDTAQISVPNIAPAPVTNLKAAPAGKGKVTLTWTASTKAEGYLVYGQKNGKYGYVGMVGSGSRTTFTDIKAMYEEYNFYWVFPYVKNTAGKMVPGGCTKYVFAKGILPAASGLKAASIKGGIRLSWNAVQGADGYLVYGIVDGKPYGYVGMSGSGTRTTFTDKKASATQFNFYWIFPYFKDESDKMVVGLTGKYTYGRAMK